jgi:molecular chaperone HscB
MVETASTPIPVKCKTCSRPMETSFFCQSCHTLYPIDTSEDHFRLFGLPRTYAIDPDDLHKRFIEISRRIHPDYFEGEADTVRELALRLSAQINEAYRVLKDPIARGEYLLESSGGKSSAEDKSVPGNLLGEVLMIREEIEDAKAAGDADALAALRGQIEQRVNATQGEVAALCGKLDEPDAEVLGTLRQKLNALRYLTNLLKET